MDFNKENNKENLVLYRKYRPKHFTEVVGQENIISVLTNAVKIGKIAHAYLFSGPRGVGKTTVARLVAKALNCEGKNNRPCNVCKFCDEFNEGRSVNLIEIDAASNRGIDEIRELREGVKFIPSAGKYKCYVVDEVHMLTKEAFNALLKTLEEPPAHAVFVLATTELDKVPATIISRTQHYSFRRPKASEIAKRLLKISKEEGIKLDGDGAKLIALASEGSVRDAESILGQMMSAGAQEITRKEIENVLGLPRNEMSKKLFELIAKKDLKSSLALIREISDAGYDLSYFAKTLLQYFRNALFLKTDPNFRQFSEEELLPDELECILTNLSRFKEGDLEDGLNIIFQNISFFKKTPIPELPLEITAVELVRRLGKNDSV